jgi:aryl-alcohol dehydrogenase-like predicted oxidoreductase
MKYQQLGRTGVYVSRISLGAMTFGGKTIPPFDIIGGLSPTETAHLVGVALDRGVNLIDTADVYGNGESEAFLGEALKNRRRDVVLATKFVARTGPGPNEVGQSRLHMMNALEDSLRRLRTDYIDLYQVHGFDPLTSPEEGLRALDDAVRQGKVRYIGCSNFAAWQVTKALGVSALGGFSSFVSVQAHYALTARDIERELIPMIDDHNLGLLVFSPLAAGLLSGKFDRNGTSDPAARRALASYYPPVDEARAFEIIDVLKEIAQRREVSAARVALAWLLAQPATTSIIVGARRHEQLTDNLAAVDVALTTEDLAALDQVSRLPPWYPGWIQEMAAPQRFPGYKRNVG